jgi:hypothetical protein
MRVYGSIPPQGDLLAPTIKKQQGYCKRMIILSISIWWQMGDTGKQKLYS